MKHQLALGCILVSVLSQCVSSRGGSDRTRKQVCRYRKGDWGPCNTVTNTMMRTLTLKNGPDTCERTKTITKKCKKACKYQRGKWSICDPNSLKKTMTLTLKEGSEGTCNATQSRVKNCRARKTSVACRYMKGEWGECDATHIKTRILTLTNGPESCEARKTMSKPCKKVCKYDKGTWSACSDENPPNKKRTDTLKSGSPSTCQTTREVIKNCRNQNGRARGVDKTGLRPAGSKKREGCQFSQWSKWECTDGVKTQTRRVIAGGDKCQRRTVKKKAC